MADEKINNEIQTPVSEGAITETPAKSDTLRSVSTTHSLKQVYRDIQGDQFTYTLSNVSNEITTEDVQDFVDVVLDSKNLSFGGVFERNPYSIKSAALVSTTTTTFDVA